MGEALTTWLWTSIAVDYYVMMIVTRDEQPIFGITFAGLIVEPRRLVETWEASNWLTRDAWEEYT